MDEDENKQIAYYTRFLLNGGKVKNVQKSLIPKIKIILTISKKKAISKGQKDTVKQIQSILLDLDKVENQMASKPKKDRFSESQQTILLKNQAKQQSPENMNKSQSALSLHQNKKNLPYIQRSQSRQISTKKYSDEQLEEMLQSMINGTKNEIEIDSIPDLKQYVNLKINNLVDNGELIEAQKYETINQQLVSFTASKHKYDLKSHRKKEYINQLKKLD